MERKNQLLQQLQALRKQLPTSAALTTQISKINAKYYTVFTPLIQKIPLPLHLPAIPDHFYNNVPATPLFSAKYVQQLAFSSGFDSTWRIQLKELHSDPDNIPTPTHTLAYEFYEQEMQQHSTMDKSLAESLLNDLEDDSQYIKSHVVMEIMERFHDHNKIRTEVSAYNMIDRYGDEIAIENQYYKTLTPYQTYFQPQIYTIQQFYLHCRYTNLDYNYQIFPDRINCCFYPNYDRNKLQTSDYPYRDKIFQFGSEEFNAEISFRQKSAHELWIEIFNEKISTCKIQSCYYSIIEDYNLDLKNLLLEYTIKNDDHNQIDDVVTSVLTCAEYILNLPILEYNPERQFVFDDTLPFDDAIKSLIQYKTINNMFFTFDKKQKRDFLAPLIAERLLTYTRMGSFSNYISNLTFESCPRFQTLTNQMLNSFKLQHIQIIKNSFYNVHNAQNFITAEVLTEQSNIKNIITFRPICGCYICNICAIYDASFFDYQLQIFPNIPIVNNQINSQQLILELFNEPLKNIDKQFPFIKQVISNCKKQSLQLQLISTQFSTEKVIHHTQKNSDFSDDVMFSTVVQFAEFIPKFIFHTKNTVPIFSDNFRQDAIFCFAKNPHLIQFLDQDAIEEISEVSNVQNFDYTLNFRLQPLNQSLVLQRNYLLEGAQDVDYSTQKIENWSFLQSFISVYGSQMTQDADFLEETPLDAHYDEKVKVSQGKILGELGPTAMEKKVADVFYKRRFE